MVRQDGEMTGLKRVPKVSHGLIDRQELPVVGPVFFCAGSNCLERRRWTDRRFEFVVGQRPSL